MCLYTNRLLTRTFKRDHKGDEYVTLWKEVHPRVGRTPEGKLTYVFVTPIFGIVLKGPGRVTSNRTALKRDILDNRGLLPWSLPKSVSRGIHVYLPEREAANGVTQLGARRSILIPVGAWRSILIPVLCRMDELVACGHSSKPGFTINWRTSLAKAAVFMSIEITPEAWAAAQREAHRRTTVSPPTLQNIPVFHTSASCTASFTLGSGVPCVVSDSEWSKA